MKPLKLRRPPTPSSPALQQRLRRGVYLLPSLFTLGNILLGFYAVIVAESEGDFMLAATLVILAGVLDSLDGRIARMTGTESEFGKELDSLADVLTFGAAPAYLSYLWALRDFERLGWLFGAYYLICTATRLARFNVQTKIVDSRYFVGLPSPAAAGVVVAVLFWMPALEEFARPETLSLAMLILVPIAGSLMISTFRYPSFKNLNLRQRLSYRGFAVIGLLVLVLFYQWQAFFLILAFSYASVGPLQWLFGRLRRRGDTSPPEPASEPAPATHA
jgi:CDP-diacylglycerol--serine O-phosphatidyltransferase